LVALSARHRQEAELAVAEERERVAAETAATLARASWLAAVKLAAARAEVEAAAAAKPLRPLLGLLRPHSMLYRAGPLDGVRLTLA
jgi:hypothetical protein